jgi:hypothetical protein
MSETLTSEDVSSIDYFWGYQRDLPNWTGWEARMPVIRRDWPELMAALEEYESALRVAEDKARAVSAVIRARRP